MFVWNLHYWFAFMLVIHLFILVMHYVLLHIKRVIEY